MIALRGVSPFICRLNRLNRAQLRMVAHVLHIRRDPGADNFHLSLKCTVENQRLTHDFNLNRRTSETVGDLLMRLQTNMMKKKGRKTMKNTETSTQPAEITVNFKKGALIVDSTTSCEELFFSKMSDASEDLSFVFCNTEIPIVLNPPLALKFAIPASIMAGFFIFPSKILLRNALLDQSEFRWYLSSDLGKNWTLAAEGFIFSPSSEDVGSMVKCVCRPSDGVRFGHQITAVSAKVIQPHPGHCPYTNRHNFTSSQLSKPCFRVLTYNILADRYATTSTANQELFPYCPPFARAWEYRKQLLLPEILGYNADILCLQEVDTKAFDYDFKEILGSLGNLDGVFAPKLDASEGVAVFYNRHRFRLLDKKVCHLSSEIDSNPIFLRFYEKIKSNPELLNRVKELPTVAQAVIIEENDDAGKILVISNTHLYFHPDSDHIRLLQGGMLLTYLEGVVSELQEKRPNSTVALLFCGDFNSTPDCGIFKLLTENHVPMDCIDWKSKEGQEISGLELNQPFSMDSAAGIPLYTNFTEKFVACLDYIYYQKNRLSVAQVVPLPNESDLRANVALPSIVFPSDHIAVVTDLSWLPPPKE